MKRKRRRSTGRFERNVRIASNAMFVSIRPDGAAVGSGVAIEHKGF
jgi:hypothetical protein